MYFLIIFGFFKEHEVNQEDCSKQSCLDLDIQVHGEADAKVISISEGFLEHTGPLLRDLPNLEGYR